MSAPRIRRYDPTKGHPPGGDALGTRAVRLLTRWPAAYGLLGACLLQICAAGASADEFRTPSISAVRVEWRAVLDQLRAEINTQPAIASAFTLASQRRAPGWDPRSTPALVQFLRSWLARLPVPEVTQDEEGEEEELYPDPTPEQEELLEALRPVCHLFSLLQAAVGTRLPGGRQPDPKIAAVARGQTDDDDGYDEAWWHYGDPRSKTPDLRESIWGEGLLTEIPIVNGSRVMLLWPPIMQSRTWGSGFFGPHLQALPANVVVEEELSPESAREWSQALGIR